MFGWGSGALFRFRPAFAFLGTAGSSTGASFIVAVTALRRAERLEDMAYSLLGLGKLDVRSRSPLRTRDFRVSEIVAVPTSGDLAIRQAKSTVVEEPFPVLHCHFEERVVEGSVPW